MDPPQSPSSLLARHQLHQQEVKSKYGEYVMTTYFCDSSLLAKMSIENWIYNRPADESRVAAVSKDINSSGRVQGIIALASLSGQLVCYDGNHRRLALSRLGKSYKILLTVIWAANDDAIIDEYESLNKSVSVPLVFLPDPPAVDAATSDAGLEKKGERELGPKQGSHKWLIAEFCKDLSLDYPKLSSSARACHTPHFNRDVLADDLLYLYEDYPELSMQQIIDVIWKMNAAYSRGRYGFKKEQLSASVQVKCTSSGLWLFCKKRTIDRRYFDLVKEQM